MRMPLAAIDMLIPLCKGCETLVDCSMRLIPVLRCNHWTGSMVRLKEFIAREASEVGRVIVIATPTMLPEQLLELVKAIHESKKEEMIVFAPWELVVRAHAFGTLEELLHYGMVYTYVVRVRDAETVAQIAKGYGELAEKMSILYYATSPHDAHEMLRVYRWSMPRLALALPEPAVIQVKPVVSGHGFIVAERRAVANISMEKLVDSKEERVLELLILARFPRTAAVSLVHASGILRVTREGAVYSLETRDLMDTLCSAVWRVNLEALVNGIACVNERLIRILHALTNASTLKAASEITGLSYPTIRQILREAEHVLGTRLVKVSKGGSTRGGAVLTADGMTVLKLYEEVRGKLEEELAKLVKEVCRSRKPEAR